MACCPCDCGRCCFGLGSVHGHGAAVPSASQLSLVLSTPSLFSRSPCRELWRPFSFLFWPPSSSVSLPPSEAPSSSFALRPPESFLRSEEGAAGAFAAVSPRSSVGLAPAFAAAAAFAASTSSRVGQSLSDSSSFSEEELRVLVGSGIPTSVHGPAGLTGAELTIGPKGALALEGFFLGGRLKLTPSARQQPSRELVWRRLPPSPAASPKAGLESRPRQQPPAGSWSGELSSPAASLLGSWSGDGTVLASSLPVGSWSGEFVFS